MGDCLRDLAHLLLTYRQTAHCLCRVDIDMHPLKELFRLFVHFLIINTDAFFKFSSDEDILGNCQMPQHVQLLVHDNDARILSLTCIVEFHFFSFICNGSGILFIDTCQHLHQR